MILTISGLPGSGKTTFAKEWVLEDPTNRLRVNYDDLRVELYGCKGPTYFGQKLIRGDDIRTREANVKAQALGQAEKFILANPPEHSVIIDNTNLTSGSRRPWEQLAAGLGVDYEQQDMSTSVAECVQRDQRREGDDRVGRVVIERMALFTGWIDWHDETVYPFDQFVVVDIDGTLSDPSHRLHHVKGEHKRWDLFAAEVDADPPKVAIVQLVRRLANFYNILIVSGRGPENGCGLKTEEWLDLEVGSDNYLHVFMRQAGDYKPDYEHKQEILDLLPRERIAFCLDDRQQVVDMWRKNGLTCLQVEKGAF